MTYQVKNERIDGDRATITTEIEVLDYKKAVNDIITFHIESDSDVQETIDKIKACGKKPGLVIKPNTKAEEVFPYLKDLFMVLVMTVEPGFGGQSFMADMLPKVKEIREEANKVNPELLIEVDGGIGEATIKQAYDAGVDVCVAVVFKITVVKPFCSDSSGTLLV